MNYEMKTLMTKDFLQIVRFISSDIFRRKSARMVLIVMFIIYFVSILMHTYYFISEFSFDLIIKYLPLFSWSIFGNLAIFILLWKPALVCEIKHEVDLWAKDSFGIGPAVKIKKESFIISLFTVANSLLSLFTSMLHWIVDIKIERDLWSKFHENFYIFGITEIFDFLFKVSIVPFTFVMVVHSYQVIYYTQHLKFQSCLLRNGLENLTNDFERTNDLDLIFSTEYQLAIKKRLKFCIIRHIQLIRASYNKNKEIKLLIVAFSIAGCFHGIGCIIYVYLNFIQGVLWQGLLPLILFVTTFSSLIMAGQTFQGENERLADAISKIAWYTFDKKNRQILLIMHPNLLRAQKIKFTDNVVINYALGISIVKAILSVISVMFQIRLRGT